MAGIGEMVPNENINEMTSFMEKYGEERFRKVVYNGMFMDVAMAYVHPCDEMRETYMFTLIQRAFINAIS